MNKDIKGNKENKDINDEDDENNITMASTWIQYFVVTLSSRVNFRWWHCHLESSLDGMSPSGFNITWLY